MLCLYEIRIIFTLDTNLFVPLIQYYMYVSVSCLSQKAQCLCTCMYFLQSGSINIRIVVMNNLLPTSIRYHEKYDLKGSTYKRRAGQHELTKKSPTFKDLDLMEKHPEVHVSLYYFSLLLSLSLSLYVHVHVRMYKYKMYKWVTVSSDYEDQFISNITLTIVYTTPFRVLWCVYIVCLSTCTCVYI